MVATTTIPWLLVAATILWTEAVASGKASGGIGWASRLHLGARRAAARSSGRAELPTCTCDCCDVTERHPDEYVAGVKVKCTPSTGHSADTCATECMPDPDDQLFQAPATETIDSQRFCFYECRPSDGPISARGAQCVALDRVEIDRIKDHSGNAGDPALLYAQPLQRNVALVAARRSPQDAAKQAKELAMKGWKQAHQQADEARTQAEMGREVEAQKSMDLNKELHSKGLIVEGGPPPGAPPPEQDAFDPFQSVRDIHEAMLRSGRAAKEAASNAEKAVELVHQGKKLMWEASVEVGQQAMQAVKGDMEAAAAFAAKRAKMMTDHSGIKASEAAAKASEPYFLGMLRAQQSAADYRKKGNEMSKQAMELDGQAKALAKQANALNMEGKAPEAQAMILNARDVAKEAQAFTKDARQAFATAKETDLSIPKFVAAARSAAARAAYDANPAWNPGANTR